MDIFISIAKTDDAAAHHELSTLFTRLFNGQIHETTVPYVTSTYLFCLHKDAEDPTKLRPLGVPTAIRRILSSHVAKSYRIDFARLLETEDGLPLVTAVYGELSKIYFYR